MEFLVGEWIIINKGWINEYWIYERMSGMIGGWLTKYSMNEWMVNVKLKNLYLNPTNHSSTLPCVPGPEVCPAKLRTQPDQMPEADQRKQEH